MATWQRDLQSYLKNSLNQEDNKLTKFLNEYISYFKPSHIGQ